MIDEYNYLIKTIILGDDGVGKETLMLNYTKSFFTEDYKMTIGVDYHAKTIELETNDGLKVCKLQLWVIYRQERFSSLRPMFYRGSLGAFLMFDLTNHLTFEHLPKWIKEVKENSKYEIPILIVGNKSDLYNQRIVSKDEIEQFTKENNLQYTEISAKTGESVEESFYTLTRLMVEGFSNKRKALMH